MTAPGEKLSVMLMYDAYHFVFHIMGRITLKSPMAKNNLNLGLWKSRHVPGTIHQKGQTKKECLSKESHVSLEGHVDWDPALTESDHSHSLLQKA